MVSLALLAALVIVLQTVASNIKVGPIPITLTLVPIVIGAVLYGPGAGALLGAIFGLVTAVAGLTGYDAGTQALIQASPVWTILTCFVKATAAGWVAGLVYRALRKKQTLGCVLAAMSAPVVNTGIFLLAMTTVLRSSLETWAGGTDMVYYCCADGRQFPCGVRRQRRFERRHRADRQGGRKIGMTQRRLVHLHRPLFASPQKTTQSRMKNRELTLTYLGVCGTIR